MEPIRPCNTYAARPAGTARYQRGRHAFKVYFVDIPGRAEPARYEWDRCGRERKSVVEALERASVEGVGFVVAFPHITKVFRFAPSLETVLHVRAFHTPDFAPLDLGREEGYVEQACLAEAVLAGAEYRLWAEAPSVEAYLGEWVDWAPAAIRDHRKLARHYDAA